jgi:formamidopyrimidine-DNA glycosylase
MPELPEVEAARLLLEGTCVGKRLGAVDCREQGGGPRNGLVDDIVLQSAPKEFQALVGRTLRSVGRKGKQLWLDFGGATLCLHFGMTGSLVVRGIAAFRYQEFTVHDETWPPRFAKLCLSLGEREVALADPRRLGRVSVTQAAPEDVEAIAKLAPDPLTPQFVRADFVAGIRKSAAPIKAVLLDQQRLVSGVGNWIADEVCFRAALRPDVAGTALTAEMADAIFDAVVGVCADACGCIRDQGQLNGFPKGWLFHSRWGIGPDGTGALPDGRTIRTSTVGGRTTAVVPCAQHLPKAWKAPVLRRGEHKRHAHLARAAKAFKVPASSAEASRKRKVVPAAAEKKQKVERGAAKASPKPEVTPKPAAKPGAKLTAKATAKPKEKPKTKADARKAGKAVTFKSLKSGGTQDLD